MDFRSIEFMFARDFVFYVMKQWRPEWKSENQTFLGASEDSPFTENMRNKIRKHLEDDRPEIQRGFEKEFPNAEIDEAHFQEMAEKYHYNCMQHYRTRLFFNSEQFFSFCLKLSKFAGLAVCFRVDTAPFIIIETIYKTIDALQNKGLFTETSWADMDNSCAGN